MHILYNSSRIIMMKQVAVCWTLATRNTKFINVLGVILDVAQLYSLCMLSMEADGWYAESVIQTKRMCLSQQNSNRDHKPGNVLYIVQYLVGLKDGEQLSGNPWYCGTYNTMCYPCLQSL